MMTYTCNHCKKAIDEEDYEAIEVKPIQQRALFPLGKEPFVQSWKNRFSENQRLHYCGECKALFYDFL
ncbi:hypothetical protein [Bacillus methanolicus]|uniref:hypothetical protein n=1 Tax=Bacillus methanolicus TaxID=1471 RepID=UPI000B0BF868|nr:hypothetical protein [Bacillus methanolicus]